MDNKIIPRMVMAGHMFGKRPVGKPKKRWMDAVKEDSYQILNWRNLEVEAQDRDECRSRIKTAKALDCSVIDEDLYDTHISVV
jgi:hypothetical protein